MKKLGRPKTGPSKEYLEKLELLKEEYLSSKITLRNVCKKHNISREYASVILKQQGISLRKKISSDDTLFEKIDTEEKAYWLGFLYADGSVYKNNKGYYRFELGLAEKDLIHIEKFKKFVNSKHDIKYRVKTKSFRIVFSDPQFTKNLIDLGCVPNKSLILTFPTEDQVPLELQKHFIRGYFDGDGSISYRKSGGSPGISVMGTLEFLLKLNEVFKNLAVIAKKDKRHLNNTYTLRFRVQPGINFLYLIYNDSNIFLTRKYEKYNFLLNCKSGEHFLKSLN